MKPKHIAFLTVCSVLLCAPLLEAQQKQGTIKQRTWPLWLRKQPKEDVVWPSNLSSLKNIPPSNVIEQVALDASIYGGEDNKLDEQSFKKLMDTAKTLDANDPEIKRWHFAPWYSGSFVVKNETYYFHLYLGGMGKLLTPQKEKGMFKFEHKSESKK